MFRFFKRFGKSRKTLTDANLSIKLVDINSIPLKDGDKVFSLRYGLEECILQITDEGVFYKSIKTGEKISYTKMVDASTEFQKVRKLEQF